jgi:hypothetical protein
VRSTLDVINQMRTSGIISKYAIGGAVGATFYLEPSATLDVDVFVVLPTTPGSSLLSLTPLYEHLMTRGCKVDGAHIVIGDWPVQFLAPRDGLEHEALAQAVETTVEGTPTWVMTAEHLVAIALRTGRAKDFTRILQFLEADVVDADKLDCILTRHGLVPKWEQFKRKYLEG